MWRRHQQRVEKILAMRLPRGSHGGGDLLRQGRQRLEDLSAAAIPRLLRPLVRLGMAHPSLLSGAGGDALLLLQRALWANS